MAVLFSRDDLEQEMKPAVVGLITLTVVALLLVAAVNLSGMSLTQGFANYGETNERGTFIMYYADWCPHCQHAKPDFLKFMGPSNIIRVKGQPIKVRMVEEKEIKKGVDPAVKGYPSFLYTDAAGKTVEYNGPRNPDGYMAFLEKQVLG